MKRLVALLSLISLALIIVSCASGRYPYPHSSLAEEKWESSMEVNPQDWAKTASPWFRSGGKTRPQIRNEDATYRDAMSKTVVDIKEFEKIRIEGDFYVQLSGADGRDHVTIVGPNEAIRAISVKVNKGVLCIKAIGKKKSLKMLDRVTVVIGVNKLSLLEHIGNGNVEGVKLYGDDVTIKSYGKGCIYLSGRLNVKCVDSKGQGAVNIYTTDSYGTIIKSTGAGAVNIFAVNQVLLRNIKHRGSSDINVINATSNGLNINAKGRGKISIKGRVNVQEIRANGKVCILISNASSDQPCLYLGDEVKVGMKGHSNVLYLYSSGSSTFWGRGLINKDVYVRASGLSHANVMATNKAWITARDYASVYFYGDPIILSAFEKNSGTVVTMGPSIWPKKQKRRHRDYKAELMGML